VPLLLPWRTTGGSSIAAWCGGVPPLGQQGPPGLHAARTDATGARAVDVGPDTVKPDALRMSRNLLLARRRGDRLSTVVAGMQR